MHHVPRSVDALFGQSRLLIECKRLLSVSTIPAHDLTNAIYIIDTTTPGMASPQLVF